ncbi:hypothetical protein diail_1982 [Diaporthe ilicicola]|nr:hypothetical protein diail_1982 [Diaporthe ilicicola]
MLSLSAVPVLALLLSGASAEYAATASTCRALADKLPGLVFSPDSNIYNASIASYPWRQTQLHPDCVVQPTTAVHVATALIILREDGTKFALRGGGHNINVGFSNIEDGVTISLERMNKVEVNGDVALVGAGTTGQQLYEQLEMHDMSALGPRLGGVGVAGFTTGGGISFSGPERGWAADSILNVEIVLADSSIVNANSTSNADLLAAVKGGQANFGIITRFDLQAFPARPVWGGLINYDAEQGKSLITAFSEFKKPENYDPYAAGWISYQYNGTNAKLTPGSSMWYSKADQAPGALGRITNIGPKSLDLTQVALPSVHSKAANDGFKSGGLYRTIWTTLSFHISPTVLHRIYDHWLENIPAVVTANSIGTDIPFSELYIQSGMPRPCESEGPALPNGLGWPPAPSANASHPWKDVVVFQLCLSWQDERATSGLEDAAKKMIAEFEDMIRGEGL